tara:strand:- start:1243 stop:2061 length:819 start_codon:yes stop_codon:yes gene_type:complete
MAYIGKQPVVGNFQVCDAISVVNGQAAYTMQVGSANVEPENANHMLVSLNGVLQKPGSSFTISGATITFASNLATGDVIDFIILLGDTLNIGSPSDDAVTTAKIADGAVTSAKLSSGKILQVVNTHYTDKASSTSDTPADVSGFSADITPSSASNKVLVMVTVSFGGAAASYPFILCQREISGGATTSLALGTSASGNQVNTFLSRYIQTANDQGTSSKNFLDTPNTTSAITYQIQLASPYGTSYINRQSNSGNYDYIQFPSSTITLMEVAG